MHPKLAKLLMPWIALNSGENPWMETKFLHPSLLSHLEVSRQWLGFQTVSHWLPMAFWFLRQSKEMLIMCPPLLGLFPYIALVKPLTEHSRLVPIFPLHRCKYKHLRTQLDQIHNVGLPLGYCTNPGISDC